MEGPLRLDPWIPLTSKTDAAVRFDAENLRNQVVTGGVLVDWERASTCPCERRLTMAGASPTRTSENRSDCAICGGSGIFYYGKTRIPALMTSAEKKPALFRQYGDFATAMIRLSVLPECLPSYLDRFTLVESTITYRESRERKAQVETLRYPIAKRKLVRGTLGNFNAAEFIEAGVQMLITADADGMVDATPLVPNTDFAITASGDLDWQLGDVTGRAPPVGDLYSIAYYCNPVYTAQGFPHAIRDVLVVDGDCDPATTDPPAGWFRVDLGDGSSTIVRLDHLSVAVDCWLEFLGNLIDAISGP
jgi:hypothetical protein